MSCSGISDKYVNTRLTSHIAFYRGRDGRLIYTPLTKRQTSGWDPNDTSPVKVVTVDKAERAVFIAL